MTFQTGNCFFQIPVSYTHLDVYKRQDEYGVTRGAEEMLALAEEVIRLEDSSHQAQEMKMEMYYVKGRYKIARCV